MLVRTGSDPTLIIFSGEEIFLMVFFLYKRLQLFPFLTIIFRFTFNGLSFWRRIQ